MKLIDSVPDIILNKFNLLKPKIYIMYRQLSHSEIVCSAHNAFMCFAWVSEHSAIISLHSIT